MAKTPLAAAISALLIGCATEPSDQLQPSDLTFHQAPQITIDSPAAGSFVAPSADGTIEVSGKANGASLALNGKSIAVDSHGAIYAAAVQAKEVYKYVRK